MQWNTESSPFRRAQSADLESSSTEIQCEFKMTLPASLNWRFLFEALCAFFPEGLSNWSAVVSHMWSKCVRVKFKVQCNVLFNDRSCVNVGLYVTDVHLKYRTALQAVL